MKRLLIVRHGNTFLPGEPPRRIGARTDLPLTDEGRAQARRLGEWFAAEQLEAGPVLCGSLARTMETAELLSAAMGGRGRPIVAAWLNEIDHGPDEGQPEDQVIARLGQPALDRWDRLGEVPPGWHVDPGLRRAVWRDQVRQLQPGTYVLVTSSGVARFAIPALIGTSMPADLKLRTGSFGVIISDAERATLVAWNVRPGDAGARLRQR